MKKKTKQKNCKKDWIELLNFLAHDHCGAHHVDTDPVRTMDHVVSITSIFAGLTVIVHSQ